VAASWPGGPVTGRVQGKVALITGAARGQGRAHAVKLASQGASIIALDICRPIEHVPYASATEADLGETVRLVEATGAKISPAIVDTRDLQRLTEVAQDAMAEFGRLDIVVANAGITIMGPWDRVTADVFRLTIDVNLVGTWNTVMACAPHMIKSGGGSIILTSSTAGLKGMPFLVPYVASKHGVTGLARAFAHELAQHGIRVNSLHPTGVRTEMSSDACIAALEPALRDNPRLRGMLTNSLPVELTEPEDQANAVLFLASDEARYVTALAMTVDAGNTQY
jgi:SDR family mycofactocin-dependent oxidoreductase